MIDRIFATIGMLMVIAFMGVVTVFVMEPDLWIVTILVLVIALVFIWRDLRVGGNHLESDSGAGDKPSGDHTAP
ncbi:MAG: hypothetical protein QGI63_12405 [Rhodospirillales bacterium]|jgi:hypothetical protein|nr:hypothetical protein [Rhodospirillales bacterium]MDP6775057.1 hypothetical protein [Rhodospirillales bacterium]